jgi:hypothetical protein
MSDEHAIELRLTRKQLTAIVLVVSTLITGGTFGTQRAAQLFAPAPEVVDVKQVQSVVEKAASEIVLDPEVLPMPEATRDALTEVQVSIDNVDEQVEAVQVEQRIMTDNLDTARRERNDIEDKVDELGENAAATRAIVERIERGL